MQKNKKIHKKKKIKKINKLNQQGQPQIRNLKDFVTSICPIKIHRPIYTGGRILYCNNKIYACYKDIIIIYSLKDNKIIDEIKHINEEIVNFGVCPFDKKIVTFTNNEMLRLLSIQNKSILCSIHLNKQFVRDLSFSVDGKHLALGLSSGRIKIYTTLVLKQTHQYTRHIMSIMKIQWHPDEDVLQLISISQCKKLVIFDYILNKVLLQIDNAGKNFIITNNRKQIITSYEQQIHIYEYKTLNLLQNIKIGQYIDNLYLHYDNNILLLGNNQINLLKLNLQTKQINKQNNIKQNGIIKLIKISYGVIVITNEQNFYIFNGDKLNLQYIIIGFNDQIIDIKYSKNKQQNKQYCIMISNSMNGKLIKLENNSLELFIQGHNNILLCCDYYHPYIITAGKDKIIKLWYINQFNQINLICNYKGHSGSIYGLSFMIINKFIVSISQDSTLKLWNFYYQTTNIIKHQKEIKSAIRTIHAHQKEINAVRVSNNQKYIATCSHDKTIKIWNINLLLLFTLNGHRRGVWDIAFHPIEQLIISVSGDGMLKGWNLIDGQCLWSMGQGQGIIRCQWIYYHQVITGSTNGIIKLWDIRKKTSLSYDKHKGRIWAMDVRINNENKLQIITGGNDSIFMQWKDNTQQIRYRIMNNIQQEQKQRILYQQYRYNKQYFKAGKIALKQNYIQLFLKIMQDLQNNIQNLSCNINQQGELQFIMKQNQNIIEENQWKIFIQQLCQININRLFNIIYQMNSTIKYYKLANKMLFLIFQIIGFQKILELNSTYISTTQNNRIQNNKQIYFEEIMKQIKIIISKHYNRINKYIKGTYWLDYLKQQENPILF